MPTPLLDVKGIRNTSPRWRVRLVRGAKARGLEPSLVAAVMSFETKGTFSTTIKNPHSGAVGLVQWTNIGAKAQGTTRERIARMTADQQLELALDAFAIQQRDAGTLARPVDYYLAILWPAGIGAPYDEVLFAAGSTAYSQNMNLDTAAPFSEVTAGEVAAHFSGVINDARSRPPIMVLDERWPYLVAGLAVAGAAAAGAWWVSSSSSSSRRRGNPGRSKAAEKKLQWGLYRTAAISSKDREAQARQKRNRNVERARKAARAAIAREKSHRAEKRDDYRQAVGQLERRQTGKRYSRAESDSLALHNVPRALRDLFLEERRRFPYTLEPDHRAEKFVEWTEEHPEEITAWKARTYEQDDDELDAAYAAYLEAVA